MSLITRHCSRTMNEHERAYEDVLRVSKRAELTVSGSEADWTLV